MVENFEYKEVDFNNMKFTSLDNISEDQFNRGLSLYKIAHELNLNGEFKSSLNAIFQAWDLGYQAPATFEKAAIIARKLKAYDLEMEILELAKKYFRIEFVTGPRLDEKLEWANKRLERVKYLNRKNIN